MSTENAPTLAFCHTDRIPEWRALARAVCSPAEWERAERFRTEALARRFLTGRAMLRHLLADAVGGDPSAVRLSTAESGRLVARELDLEVSPSYERSRVGVLVGPGPIGLDLEYPERRVEVDALARHVFTARETAAFDRLPQAARRDFFFQRWVEKEAVSKAMGLGLGVGFPDFDAAAGADELGGDLLTGTLDDGCLTAVLIPRDTPHPDPFRWAGPTARTPIRIAWRRVCCTPASPG